MNANPPPACMDENQAVLNTAEAAKLLHVSPKTLAFWRSTGDGPVFLRLGVRTVRYRRTDLLAYLEGRLMVNSLASHLSDQVSQLRERTKRP